MVEPSSRVISDPWVPVMAVGAAEGAGEEAEEDPLPAEELFDGSPAPALA
jgi:hypothetical protein